MAKKLTELAWEQVPTWRPFLSMYEKKRALKFTNREAFSDGIDILYLEEFLNMPFSLVGDYTVIVPEEAEDFIGRYTHHFTSSDVLRACDLPPEEIGKLRREQGPF